MFEKQNPEVGSRPGTLAIPPGSPKPKIVVTCFDRDSVESHEVEEVSELRSLTDERVTWVDVQGFGDESIIRAIGDAFELHPVVLENAVNVPQRAKSKLYERYQLVVARTPLVGEDEIVRTPQACFIIGENYVLTFQERYYGFFDPVRERIRAGVGLIREGGSGYLAYALIDAMLREGSPYFNDQEKVYLRDTYDHMAQIVELIDSSREMASDLADAYLSNVAHRTNEIMKVLTLMASIFIPLTFVAGIYGMNFEHMPELHSRNGYFVVWGVMIFLATCMVIYFKRRGWIGATPPPEFVADADD